MQLTAQQRYSVQKEKLESSPTTRLLLETRLTSQALPSPQSSVTVLWHHQ